MLTKGNVEIGLAAGRARVEAVPLAQPARVDGDDALAAVAVGARHLRVHLEAPRPQQRGVDELGAVGEACPEVGCEAVSRGWRGGRARVAGWTPRFSHR